MSNTAKKQGRVKNFGRDDSTVLWNFEKTLVSHITSALYAGVDEVGRGALAGPVYAAAVILGGQVEDWLGINDSKQLSRKKRENWYEQICHQATAVGVGIATVDEINSLNILHASRLAMGRAVAGVLPKVEFVLVDGTYMPLYDEQAAVNGVTVIDGDARCLSIAAASIVAKVERDRYMAELAQWFPEYGFEAHVGYATALHLSKLREFGPSPCHRKTFAPVRNFEQARLDI